MNSPGNITDSSFLLDHIISLIDTTRQNAAKKVNQELTPMYWNIGKSINVDTLTNNRADYGKKIFPISENNLRKI